LMMSSVEGMIALYFGLAGGASTSILLAAL
jgi:hypothetical protein